MTRSRRNPTRWIAGLLLPVFLCAYLLDVVHYATVEHVPCPVDGALAHVGDGHDHGAASHGSEAARESAAQGGERVAPAPSAPEGEHGHEHCSLLLLSKKVHPVLGTDLLEVGPAPVVITTAWTPTPSGPAVPLFLLAPKNSPPRAG